MLQADPETIEHLKSSLVEAHKRVVVAVEELCMDQNADAETRGVLLLGAGFGIGALWETICENLDFDEEGDAFAEHLALAAASAAEGG